MYKNRKKILFITAIIIVLILIIVIVLPKNLFTTLDKLTSKKIEEGYKELSVNGELKSVYLDNTFAYKNAFFEIQQGDEVTKIYVNNKKDDKDKLYYNSSDGEKVSTQIKIGNVVEDYITIYKSFDEGFFKIFILDVDGKIYYKKIGDYSSLEEFANDANVYRTLKTQNKYEKLLIYYYQELLELENSIALIGIKDNEEYLITKISLVAEPDVEIIEEKFDNNVVSYAQTSYELYENEDKYFTVKKDGTIEVTENKKKNIKDIKVKNIINRIPSDYDKINFKSVKPSVMYFVGEDDYLYSINKNGTIKKINKNKVYKIFYKELIDKNTKVSIIFENKDIYEYEVTPSLLTTSGLIK